MENIQQEGYSFGLGLLIPALFFLNLRNKKVLKSNLTILIRLPILARLHLGAI